MTSSDARRDLVLAALMRAGRDGMSGERLAARLGCSRAAVHRHVEALRRSGVAIAGEAGGYRLAEDSDPVSASLAEEALEAPIGGPVRWTLQTGSTNDDAAAAARLGAAEGLVIGADLQTSGRGRRGREWVTDPGAALLFSVVLRPRVSIADAGTIPLLVAVAVCDALGDHAGVVWPNDVVMGGEKVCGVLCEVSGDESGVSWIVAGIGVNVRDAPSLDDSRWTAGSLVAHGETRTRADLLVDLLTALRRRYVEWLDGGAEGLLAAYRRRDLLHGEAVELQVGTEPVSGVAAGVDDRGHLLVATPGGMRTLAAGELTKRRAPT